MSQNEIKPWNERLTKGCGSIKSGYQGGGPICGGGWYSGLYYCQSCTEKAYQAEIADLRTALASRTGGERAAALEEAAREVEGNFIGYRREDAHLVEIAAAIRALAAQPAQQADMVAVKKGESL